MAISELHASHIRKVEVSFCLIGPDLDPEVVTTRLGLTPDQAERRGDERRHQRSGAVLGLFHEGLWALGSLPRVDSKDVNDHFRWVLGRLLPHKEAVLELARGGEVFFNVLWKSTYLYAGTGPLIDAECLAGVAALGGGMGFDIYQVDEPEAERRAVADHGPDTV
ncbi:DUF4279 domain-containing protein [Urbifossiella limnaea]|uniref:DUF4279 domain-containing protein n=1 Tax=Urbifossiella limnaea TaxID=2528023 RepID=A0A517Y2L0_9BACT|nr:DUF4279 domain-containing protein [Urbifossiella limnaea]QDU23969.1 hypothetical protein ETAA1_59800 [Urbifossiella limnaea]